MLFLRTIREYKRIRVVCSRNQPLYCWFYVRQRKDRFTMGHVAMRLFCCVLVAFPLTTRSLNKAGTI